MHSHHTCILTVQLAQPIRHYVHWRTQVFKIEGFVCKRFSPSFPFPSPLFQFLALVSFLARPKPKIPFLDLYTKTKRKRLLRWLESHLTLAFSCPIKVPKVGLKVSLYCTWQCQTILHHHNPRAFSPFFAAYNRANVSLAHAVLVVVTPKMAEKRAITVEFMGRLLDTWYKSSRMMKHSLELSRLSRLTHQTPFGQRLVTHHCAWLPFLHIEFDFRRGGLGNQGVVWFSLPGRFFSFCVLMLPKWHPRRFRMKEIGVLKRIPRKIIL